MNQARDLAQNWWQGRKCSFACAFAGLAVCWRTQPNARIHAVAAVLCVGLGWWLRLTTWEWCAVIGAGAAVWAAETFNTAVEFLVDLISPGQDPRAGRIKDVAAGAVLVVASAAGVIGLLIFVPKLCAQLNAPL